MHLDDPSYMAQNSMVPRNKLNYINSKVGLNQLELVLLDSSALKTDGYHYL